MYKFYAYPTNIRARVSQIFVLPSHQKRSLGTALYENVVKHLRGLPEVVDIAVEEPTPVFQKIRDLEDCGILHQKLIEEKLNYFTTNSKKIFQLGKKIKIGRKQVQRVYDILGLYYTSVKGVVPHKKVMENIKNRLKEESEVSVRSISLRWLHAVSRFTERVSAGKEVPYYLGNGGSRH